MGRSSHGDKAQDFTLWREKKANCPNTELYILVLHILSPCWMITGSTFHPVVASVFPQAASLAEFQIFF